MKTYRARRRLGTAVTAFVLVAAIGWSARAGADPLLDVNPPMPNVMLLIDDSGSMERMFDGTSLPTCTVGTQTSPNKWGTLVQSFTGDITPFFACNTVARTSGAFASTYAVNGQNPPDFNYYLDYHQPISGGSGTACGVYPGTVPAVGPTFSPGSALAAHTPADALTSCTFGQESDGLLDIARDLVRFSVMTYDNDSDSGTGLDGTYAALSTSQTFTGQFSYFKGWNHTDLPSNPILGWPAGCVTTPSYEVGSRNFAAPPWEGRFVPFPSPTAALADVEAANDDVQSVILSTRPYGASPTAGMLADAMYYFWGDPIGPQQSDPYVSSTDASGAMGCRDEFIILVTDGAPNLDLRTSCSEAGSPTGSCPYDLPENLVNALAGDPTTRVGTYTPPVGVFPNVDSPCPATSYGHPPTSTGHRVLTYVIGFDVSTVPTYNGISNCSQLVAPGTPPTLVNDACTSNSGAPVAGWETCCEIQKVAMKGGTGEGAYFADSQGALDAALGDILSRVSQGTTTRAVPVYPPTIASATSGTVAAYYLSSFTPKTGSPWVGDVLRQPVSCGSGTPTETTPDTSSANGTDSYAVDLNRAAVTRNFFTFEPSGHSAGITTRPYVSDEGLGVNAGDEVGKTASALVSTLNTATLNVNGSSCENTYTGLYLDAAGCSNLLLNFAMAQLKSSFALTGAGAASFPIVSRNAQDGGNAMGDIYHATPVIVGPPSATNTDESYRAFSGANASRTTVLYAATNDGVLHAFDANVTSGSKANVELWSFLPPAVLPRLQTAYPSAHQFLLDGPLVAKDVIFSRVGSHVSDSGVSDWHTMLVQGFGGIGGYYAMDITDPSFTSWSKQSDLGTPRPGPHFEWQIVDPNLFGAKSGTPAITTIYADLGSGAQEYGVAILPGGGGAAPVAGTSCHRNADSSKGLDTTSGVSRRDWVHQWGAAGCDPAVGASGSVVPGRSITIVRIDTGALVMAFVGTAAEKQAFLDAHGDAAGLSDLVKVVAFDAPITGVPVVYPNDPGTLGQKIFFGDAEGTMWKVDISSADRTNWDAYIYMDAYNQTANGGSTGHPNGGNAGWCTGSGAAHACDTAAISVSPITLPPVLALDGQGNLVVTFATGDMDTFTKTTGEVDFVYSTSEKLGGDGLLHANLNWYTGKGNGALLQNGEHVSGPMAIFDGKLYFATFDPTVNANVCAVGVPHVWSYNFATGKTPGTPEDGGLPCAVLRGAGGNQHVSICGGDDATDCTCGDNTVSNYVTPPGDAGKLIPGFTIKFEPSCASSVSSESDPYASGATHYALGAVNDASSGSYKLFGLMGGKDPATGLPLSISINLPTPQRRTFVDSWAAVVE